MLRSIIKNEKNKKVKVDISDMYPFEIFDHFKSEFEQYEKENVGFCFTLNLANYFKKKSDDEIVAVLSILVKLRTDCHFSLNSIDDLQKCLIIPVLNEIYPLKKIGDDFNLIINNLVDEKAQMIFKRVKESSKQYLNHSSFVSGDKNFYYPNNSHHEISKPKPVKRVRFSIDEAYVNEIPYKNKGRKVLRKAWMGLG